MEEHLEDGAGLSAADSDDGLRGFGPFTLWRELHGGCGGGSRVGVGPGEAFGSDGEVSGEGAAVDGRGDVVGEVDVVVGDGAEEVARRGAVGGEADAGDFEDGAVGSVLGGLGLVELEGGASGGCDGGLAGPAAYEVIELLHVMLLVLQRATIGLLRVELCLRREGENESEKKITHL